MTLTLEEVIEKQKKREAKADLRRRKQEAIQEHRKTRESVTAFKRDFKVLFSKFRILVKCSFDKYNDHDAVFTYKGEKWSIAFEEWHYEGRGADDYRTSGTHWALHKWCGGWHGDPHLIVDSNDIKEGKDYSNEVIRMLKSYKDEDHRY